MQNFLVRTLTALVVACAFAACVSATNPAGPVSEAVAETGLLGTWQYAGTQDDVYGFVHVLPLSENRLQIVAINPLRSDWAVLEGYITAAGPRRVLNLRMVSSSDTLRAQLEKDTRADHPYSFIVYRLESKDRLAIAHPVKPIQTALTAGKLSGETKDAAIFVADQSARIAAAFAAASDADLFARTTVYRRIAEAP